MSAAIPNVTTIRQALATALATVTAGSTYHNTLSGNDQVKLGIYATPTRKGKAVVMIGRASITSDHGQPLGSYTRTANYSLLCWAPTTADTPDAKLAAAEKLAQDVTICVETECNASTGSLFASCISVRVSAVDFEGVEGDIASWATAVVTVEVVYEQRTGVGL